MKKKNFLLHQKAEENMKCKVKANYLEVNGQTGKGSTTVVVFVVQVGSNPKMTSIFALIRKLNLNLT